MSNGAVRSSGAPVPWDPVLPGTGAARARSLIRLYVRFTCGSQLATLVVDALILTFQSEGASATQLESYLGVKEKRIRHALETLPRDLRCTSLDISEQFGDTQPNSTGKNSNASKASNEAGNTSQVRYFVNYRTAVPFVYIHMTRMLLSLSALPLPPAVLRNDTPHSYLSPMLRRSASTAHNGVLCRACKGWFDTRDFYKSLALCPQCGGDVVMDALQRAKDRFEKVSSGGGRSVILYETMVAARKRSRSGTALSPSTSSTPPFDSPKTTTTTTTRIPASEGVKQEEVQPEVEHQKAAVDSDPSDPLVPPVQRSSLGLDPFLVQQGLYFRFLCSSVYVCVTDELFVVDAEAMMTREEYIYRSKHKATIMDQFRLLHPNVNQIRVHIPSQAVVEAEKVRENELKMAKRLSLPPWLKPMELWNAADDATEPQNAISILPPTQGDPSEASANENRQQSGSTKARKATTASSSQKHAKNEVSDGMMDLAVKIAADYYDDDFDEVNLSRLHIALKSSVSQEESL